MADAEAWRCLPWTPMPAAGIASIAAQYSDEQLQAYIAIQSAFSRAALDLTRSIAGQPDRSS
jgi:hypothetical protein